MHLGMAVLLKPAASAIRYFSSGGISMVWFSLFRLRRRSSLGAWQAYRAVFSAYECIMD
mgnify:FL=1